MCGIVGLISLTPRALDDKDSAFFLDLLIADAVRGSDGTGIFKVNHKGHPNSIKQQGSPFSLLNSSNYNNFHVSQKKQRICALVGHNRFATSGNKKTECAHPFVHGHITLVHNGTLSKEAPLPELKQFPTDSEAMCSSISKVGLKKTLWDSWGAYALVYHNAQNNTINLVRNSMRPLWICKLVNNTMLSIASEPEMLHWIIRRRFNVTGNLPLVELLPYELMTIALGPGTITSKSVSMVDIMTPAPPSYSHKYDASVTKLPFPPLPQQEPFIPSLPNPVVVVPKDDPKPNQRWVSVSSLHSYQIGASIAYTLDSTKEFGEAPDLKWIMRGTREDLSDIIIIYICRTEELRTQLEDALLVTGIIQAVLWDKDRKEHRIYVDKVTPCLKPSQTKDIVGRSVLRKLFDFFVPPVVVTPLLGKH